MTAYSYSSLDPHWFFQLLAWWGFTWCTEKVQMMTLKPIGVLTIEQTLLTAGYLCLTTRNNARSKDLKSTLVRAPVKLLK